MKDEESVQQRVASTFRQAVADMGISHASLAQKLAEGGAKVSASAVTKMLNGDRGISIDMAVRLCAVLGVDWNELYRPPVSKVTQLNGRLGMAHRWLSLVKEQDIPGGLGSASLAAKYFIDGLIASGETVSWSPWGDVRLDEHLPEAISEATEMGTFADFTDEQLTCLRNALDEVTLVGQSLVESDKHVKLALDHLDSFLESAGIPAFNLVDSRSRESDGQG